MAEPDFSLYPSRDMQMEWLQVYLQAFKLFTKNSEEEVSQQELETLYVQVNKFALVRTNAYIRNSTRPSLCALFPNSQRLAFLSSDVDLTRLLTSSGGSGH